MIEGLQGRSYVVIGASQGLGHEVVVQLLRSGANVLAVARDGERLNEASRKWLQATKPDALRTLACDMSAPGSASILEEKIGATYASLDGLVVAAGSGRPVDGDRVSRMSAMMLSNVAPALNAVDGSERFMPHTSDTAVVFVSSIAAQERISCPPEYAASKAALNAFGIHLAQLLSPIRVNIVAPGNMLTDGSVWRKRSEEEPERLAQFVESEVPLARIGDPSEVASSILFLLSPQSTFTTGTILTIDGGQSRRLA